MWQLFLAAAVAGSGYFAKQLLHKDDNKPTNHSPRNCDLQLETSPPPVDNAEEAFHEESSSIFRFSSASSGSKKSRKKLGSGGGIRRNSGNLERRLGFDKECGGELVADQRKVAKKFPVCLKKRRTSRNVSTKCGSLDVNDKSYFGWGVGVGIICMMSAGKAEISKLNTAVDETAKIVQELKAEISKRKSTQVKVKCNQPVFEKSDMENGDNEGGYASSIVTEEPHREVLEMDQLEAELQSELSKLHGCTTDITSFENKVSNEDALKPQDPDLELNRCIGVMPFELDQKLSRLLIERQESQIVDLESELQRTNSKLSEKEAELQALKDCVKRLTQFSLMCPSDEEREAQVDEEKNGHEKTMVGIKRAMDFD